MEKLIVDAEGKITIPSLILEERGLRPGNELTLVEADEGLLLYQHSPDLLTAGRWSGLSDDESRQARTRLGSKNRARQHDHRGGVDD